MEKAIQPHLIICDTCQSLERLKNDLPPKGCSISLFGKFHFKFKFIMKIISDEVDKTEFEAALDLISNWHPLLPPPFILVTVSKLRRILPAILSSDILFGTILLDEMDSPFRQGALGAGYRLLQRSKCFMFMIEGKQRIEDVQKYIYPRKMLVKIGIGYICLLKRGAF